MIYFIVMHLLKNDILIEYFTAVFNVDEREITKQFFILYQDKLRYSHVYKIISLLMCTLKRLIRQ